MESSAPQAKRLTVAVPCEVVGNERRVALVPETVNKLVASGLTAVVETGAGGDAFFADSAYAEAGATIAPDAPSLYEQADLVVKVQKPGVIPATGQHEVDLMHSDQAIVALLSPLFNPDLVERLAAANVTSFSMDTIPRITRAQSMDALSSMATIAGYKAVLMAANSLPKFFPLLMTAAGTIPPAKALIIGAGVAGLQAIATARRLGAVVEAFDTRPVVKEQVESLGASFVELDVSHDEAQDAGGYAKELSADHIKREMELIHEHAAKSDFIITTAAIPGKPSPRLILEDTVKAMRPGSVIVDLAAEGGGNCELTVAGETVVRHDVAIFGPLNVPSMLPVHGSQMYSRNVQNLLSLLIKDGQLNLDFDDEIIAGTCITHGGEVVHKATRERMNLEPAGAPAPASD